MKKVIIPFDGAHFSQGAFSFAQSLNKMSPILLAGIFLPELDYLRFFLFPASFAGPAFLPSKEKTDEEIIEKNIKNFASLCDQNNIKYKVHKDLYDLAIPQLVKETRFSDLMIIGSEIFFKDGAAGSYDYLRDALHNTKCPVLIVPEKYSFPDSIILAYDGTESSVYAIRQFANLFPEMCHLRTTLIYAGNEKTEIPDRDLIEELASCHFRNLSVSKIFEENKEKFDDWLKDQFHPLLVSGSFSRTGVSELFNRSFVINIIKEHTTPVFIAHN